jgi:type I restriction enzyme M protein
VKLTVQQLEAHLWGAANILRGKTAGQDYKNYILSLMFYKRLCDQWECEADEAIAELERQQGRSFTDREKAVFRKPLIPNEVVHALVQLDAHDLSNASVPPDVLGRAYEY